MSTGNKAVSRGESLDEIGESGDGPESEGEVADTEDVFHILSNRRRRYAILFFLYYDPEPNLRELSEQIAAWENDVPVDHVTTEQRRRVYSALQQSHLPKMDDVGVINYDSAQHVIESTDEVSVMEPYLETVPGTGIPWCLYYLGLGGIGVVLAAAAAFSAIPLSGVQLAIVLSGVLLVSGAVHVQQERRRMASV